MAIEEGFLAGHTESMFRVRLRIKRYRKDVFDPDLYMRAAEVAAANYAHAVEALYLAEVAGWSDDHGGHDATPRIKEHYPRTRINIYIRGEMAFIFAMQDMGFLRKIAIIGGYNGIPKFGKQGTLVTGRLLRNPVPVEPKRYTEKLAAMVRNGQTEYGDFGEYLREQMSKGNWRATGSEKVYE